MAEDTIIPHSDPLERRILRALEAAPREEIPAGFAARVAGQLPPLPSVVLTPARYGRRVAVACLAVLMGLMLACADRAMGNPSVWSAMETIFCTQFALLAVWLAARGYASESWF